MASGAAGAAVLSGAQEVGAEEAEAAVVRVEGQAEGASLEGEVKGEGHMAEEESLAEDWMG